jgi:hypothetical protein
MSEGGCLGSEPGTDRHAQRVAIERIYRFENTQQSNTHDSPAVTENEKRKGQNILRRVAPSRSWLGTMSTAPLARAALAASAPARDARAARVLARSSGASTDGASLSRRARSNFRATRRVRPSSASPARLRPPRAVLADAANGTFDDLEFDQEKYSWRVGGPNDIPCVHLRDVYRGEKPLEPRPSPFCTKSSCPVSIGDRTPLALNRTFVSEDDRVLLKSMAFGCVESKGSDAESDRPPPNTATADRGPVFPFRPTARKRFFEGALFAPSPRECSHFTARAKTKTSGTRR